MKAFRSTLLAVSLLVLSSTAFAGDEASHPTGKTLISGDAVTVGDLFTNVGGSSGHVLAPAPAIGQELVLSAGDLQRIVKAFRLNCPDKIDNGVTLERDAVAIENPKIVDALNSSELKDKIAKDATIEITNLNETVIVPGHDVPDMKISDVTFNERTKKFSAVLNISRDNKSLKQITVEGLASVMVHLPVLKFAVSYNTEITENNLGDLVLSETQVNGSMILKKEDLIGMTARHSIAANQILTAQDVIPPVLVKRNDLVTIIYKSGAIQLSAKARALGNGAKGESVQLINTTSKKAFEAKVTGPQTAEVNLDS